MTAPAGQTTPDSRRRALAHAADFALRAPSVHDTRPWRLELHCDRLVIRADRERQITGLDPRSRELAQTVGAALFNVRVALAARGWATEVHTFPRSDDPDLLAEVRPVMGSPDATLAALAPTAFRRSSNRRRFTGGQLPDHVLSRLTEIAEREGVLLVPVVHPSHQRMIARLTRQAVRLQDAEPAGRAGSRSATAVPRVDCTERVDLRAGDADIRGVGSLPADASTTTGPTMVLLATRADDYRACLRAGEALQHMVLELIRLDWVASPLTQAIDVPLTRARLQGELTWEAHPQMLLRIGTAATTALIPSQRRRGGAGVDSERSSAPARPLARATFSP